MTRDELKDAIHDIAVGNVDFYAVGGCPLEDDILAEFDRMRPVYDAAMVYVRHVRCRDGSGSGGLITKHHALLEAGCKAMEDAAS